MLLFKLSFHSQWQRFNLLIKQITAQQTQNICITFVQRRPNVFDVGPTLYKCYTNVLCLLGNGSYIHLQSRLELTARPAQRKALHMAHGSTTRNMLKYDPSKIAMCNIIDQKSIAFMWVESKMSYTAARNNLLMDMMEGRFSSRWDILTTSKRIMCIIIALWLIVRYVLL